MSAFAPTPFAAPVVAPDTATLFRRTPYISPGEYKQAPTAVATSSLVPGGSPQDQEAELAAVISRASGWADELCFHLPAGTLAASQATESAWVKPKPSGELLLQCNYAGPAIPVLEVDGVALGRNPQELQSMASSEAQAITFERGIIRIPSAELPLSTTFATFGGPPTASNGKVYVVWTYVAGFPHTYLAENASEGATEITLAAAEPGGTALYGIYSGTQLTIHDEASTEVIVVEAVEGLTLKLKAGLAYEHTVPTQPNSIRVSAIPWAVEQAVISLTSSLIKRRGSRAMVMASAPGSGGPGKSVEIQGGGASDEATALRLLKPYVLPVLRSSS